MKNLRTLLTGSLLAIPFYAVAQGGPPLMTDDPDTVEKGKWEINIAWIYRQLPQATESELPLFDFNRGISERAHLKFEVPWAYATSNGSTVNGDGGGSMGVKYRFIDGKGGRPSVSTYPQVGFMLSRRSVSLGLSDSGTSLLIPLQVEWELPNYRVNADAGFIVQAGGSQGWLGGVAIGKEINGTDFLAEIHGEGVFATHESNWIAQLGLRRDLGEQTTLLFAFGKTIMSANSERLSWTSYLGVQFHF